MSLKSTFLVSVSFLNSIPIFLTAHQAAPAEHSGGPSSHSTSLKPVPFFLLANDIRMCQFPREELESSSAPFFLLLLTSNLHLRFANFLFLKVSNLFHPTTLIQTLTAFPLSNCSSMQMVSSSIVTQSKPFCTLCQMNLPEGQPYSYY